MDPSPHSRFATTQWTLVWNAAVEDSKHGRPALSEIMRRYWLPLYGFARQRGLSSADAEDATQEFLLHLFDDDILAKADPAKGRFRSFLLTVWKSFLIDRYRQGMRQKRGAGANHVPIEFAESEARWQDVMGRSKLADPEVAYTSTWAQQLLQQALTNLKSDYQASGKGSLFEAFRPFLTKSLAAVDAEKDRQGLRYVGEWR